MQYERIAALVREAGALVRSAAHIEDSVRQKSLPCDLVTQYDTQVQEYLRQGLRVLIPEAGFFGEEEATHDIAGKPAWFIVDPIDGTTNFIRHLHHSAISVGLYQNGRVEYGAVYNPYFDELFTAERGKGAYLNGVRLQVNAAVLSQSLALVGSSLYDRPTVPLTLRILNELFPRVLDFRRGGAAALDFCYLAAGRGDVFFECSLSPWDFAAGSLIAEEAGAVVTTLSGQPLHFDSVCSVAVGNAINHPELMELVNQITADPDMKGRIR